MKKILVVLTESFPYSKGESFIENEINFYNAFNSVFIIPMLPNGEIRQINLPENISINKINPINHFHKIKFCLKGCFKIHFWSEIFSVLLSLKHVTIKIKALLSYITYGEWYTSQVIKVIKAQNVPSSSQIIFYSYWMMQGAYASTRLKKSFYNAQAVSRCHRWDVYEYLNKEYYLPLRKYLLNNLDKVYSISNNAIDYINKNYHAAKTNLILSRLGTNDHGVQNYNKKENELSIISCSWVVPVKRLDKIIDSLMSITDINIIWTHLGDGPLLEDMKEKSKSLPDNITCNFHGALSNKEILTHYRQNYHDIFLNVSDSEGVPVSIMEAISFGIPVIATNVGASNEIVINEESGYILEQDESVDNIRAKILYINQLSESAYFNLRKKTRKYWESNYLAITNYQNFIQSLSE